MLATRPWAVAGSLSARALHTSTLRNNVPQIPPSSSSPDIAADRSTHATSTSTSASAKLFQDAIEEETLSASTSSRDHLRLTQGPIWSGDETTPDAVLRMLVDAHKPLRTGTGVKHNAADEKIKGWMKGLKLEPRLGPSPNIFGTAPAPDAIEAEAEVETMNPHRMTIPPHLHRPWHATYTGETSQEEVPRIRYGTFIKKSAGADDLANILELQLPPGADGKTKQRIRSLRRTGKMVKRVESAREGALDYKLGLGAGEGGQVVEVEGEEDDVFGGNRQVRGSSVLGAQKGSASGLRAWAGLVEDRIQRAKDAGYFNVTKGKGKPIPKDPEAGNPHLETGELIMNRIVKRQGALPPWIELQNSLDSALTSFRSTLLTTYTTHLVRNVMSTTSLHPLPPFHTIPTTDEAWEARERLFHEENVRQINDLVRRMNAVAPSIVRRPLVTLQAELGKVKGEPLQQAVWGEIKRRAEEIQLRPDTRVAESTVPVLAFAVFPRLRRVARRSLSTLAAPVNSILGKSRGGSALVDREHTGGSSGGSGSAGGKSPAEPSAGAGLLVAVGLGVGTFLIFRRPFSAESPKPLPAAEPPTAASIPPISHLDESPGILGFLQRTILEPILTFFRFLHLFALFAPVIITAPMILVGKPQRRRPGKPVAEEEEAWGAVWWYGFLVAQMERAGPSFIKLGQWAASRADLFPASLCDQMSKLHSNGDPHSFRHTKRVLEQAFEKKFDDIFLHFEEEPIGCGAIAQVYKATLKPEIFGTEQPDMADDDVLSTSVAIKVLHPRVRKTIRRDIAIMSVFANAIDALPGMHWISLPDEVAVFGEMMNSQLDLRVEAANLDKFDENFRKRGRNVTFPRPIKLSNGHGHEAQVVQRKGKKLRRVESREVLVEEFEDALPLKYFLRNGGGPYDDKIANIGLDAFLEMLLLDNWTHGDLHPGNIMVRFYKPSSSDYLQPFLDRFSRRKATTADPAIPHQSLSATELVHDLSAVAHDTDKWLARLEQLSAEGYVPQLIFIDAGLVTSLNDKNRRDFLDLFSAVAEFDGYKAGKLMVERCRTPEHVLDEETFALKVQHLVLSVKSKTFSLAKIKISDILTDVLTAVRQHHVKLEGDFVNTVISILLLEGIGRQLDPDMDLFKSALPILRQLGRQMGTREAISAVPKGNIWAMVKLWVWVEARQVAGEASAVDDWIKYDRFTPAI